MSQYTPTRGDLLRALETARQEIYSALERNLGIVPTAGKAFGLNDPHLQLRNVIGELLVASSYDGALSQNNLSWAADEYVARKVGPQWPHLLKLHRMLVSKGARPGTPHDFDHCVRYGAYFADEPNWKSMAFQRQSYTYMIVLERRNSYGYNADAETIEIESWATHIRICTRSQDSRDPARVSFEGLKWLRHEERVAPGIGYGSAADPYFRYKDGRDRGYLCSVVPDLCGDGYRCENALRGYLDLEHVFYDLHCHIGLLEDDQ